MRFQHGIIFSFLITLIIAITLVSLTAFSSISYQHLAAAQQHQQPIETSVSIVSGASTLADKAFSPNPVNRKAGSTVTWTNDDIQFHTITSGTGISDPNKGKDFDSGLSGPTALTTKGKTFSHTFANAGQFPYFCQLHPTMVGKIIIMS
jgi:plastocyanin